jgi:phosphatidylserine/phosphatidylglycerophosphate/cardiolipin synthase-like enzyme
MTIARDIVTFAERLKGHSVDLFNPNDQDRIETYPEAIEIAERLSDQSVAQPWKVLRLALQALRIQQEEEAENKVDVEFVATLPARFPQPARATRQVIQEMLRPQCREVILLGYEFSDHTLIDLLAHVADCGADVIVICDRERGSARKILESWPAAIHPPRVFQDRERDHAAAYASMHAKCLLVDSKDLLVTSANFTFHGMEGNIEMGVRLIGAAAAPARKIFAHLLEDGIVEQVT